MPFFSFLFLVCFVAVNIREEGFYYSSGRLKDKNWKKIKKSFLEKLHDLEGQAVSHKLKEPLRCRICGKEFYGQTYFLNGWLWPGIIHHYIEEHNVRPSDSFLEFCLSYFNSFTREEKDYYDIDLIKSEEYIKKSFVQKFGYIDFFRKRNTISPLPLFSSNIFSLSIKQWPKSVKERFIDRLEIVENSDFTKIVKQESVCVVCSRKEDFIYSWFEYKWTGLLPHYIERHSFIVPFSFYKKVLSFTESKLKVSKSEQFLLNKNEF